MSDAPFDELDNTSICNLKPGLRNISAKGIIVEYIDDPPQSTTEIQNFRYHYRFADATASIQLAVPHEILNDIVIKSSSILTLKNGHNKQNIEKFLFAKNIDKVNFNKDDPGYIITEPDGVITSINGGFKRLGNDLEDDSDWGGFSDDENKDSLKWLLKPGDVIIITSALTTWSHGQLVLVPNIQKEPTLHKIGKYNLKFNLELDISKNYSNKE